MGVDYQKKKNNPYFLPKTLYRRCLATIRDYERQKEEINDILYGTTDKDSVNVGGGEPGRPTETAVLRLEKYMQDVRAVEKALLKIPEEYRKGVFRNIVYRERFPNMAHYNTWIRWKQRYVWEVGNQLNLI